MVSWHFSERFLLPVMANISFMLSLASITSQHLSMSIETANINLKNTATIMVPLQ